MRRIIFLGILSLVFVQHAKSQESTSFDSLPFDLQKNAFIYSTATRYSDPAVARMALYNLLAYNPANTSVLDSLALSYIEARQYPSAILAAQDVLKVNPNDMLATEIAAVAFESLGIKERSIAYYENLYLAKNEINVLYKIGFMQLDLKRFVEASTTADILIKDPKTVEEKLLFQKSQQENQEISMLAAAYRLKAMVAADQGNVDEARTLFNQALEVEPEFVIVKTQLENLGQ